MMFGRAAELEKRIKELEDEKQKSSDYIAELERKVDALENTQSQNHDYMQENNLEIDDKIATAFQYQDIITQQLDASLEAIDSMRQSIAVFSHAFKSDEDLANGSLMKLQEKLNSALKEAKEKKERFSGKSADNISENDEIEFF